MFHQNLSNPRIFKALSKELLYDLATDSYIPRTQHARTTPRYCPDPKSVLARGRPRRPSVASTSSSRSSVAEYDDSSRTISRQCSRPISAATTATLGFYSGHGRFPSTTTLDVLGIEYEHPKDEYSPRKGQKQLDSRRSSRNMESVTTRPSNETRARTPSMISTTQPSSPVIRNIMDRYLSTEGSHIEVEGPTFEETSIRPRSHDSNPDSRLFDSSYDFNISVRDTDCPPPLNIVRRESQITSPASTASRFSPVVADFDETITSFDPDAPVGYRYDLSETAGPYGEIRYMDDEDDRLQTKVMNKVKKAKNVSKNALKRFSCHML